MPATTVAISPGLPAKVTLPASEPIPSPGPGRRPRLVVLGCGFAGYSLLRRLPHGLYDATMVSPRNYFLFTPLLPSAVTGTVELRSILEPARRRLRNVRLIEASAERIDLEQRVVYGHGAIGGEAVAVPYDILVVAVGARPSDFGIPGVKQHALQATSVEDAQAIRRRLLEQLARADLPGLDEAEKRRHLTFVVCGGGPTGVEVAAEIHDLIGNELARSFPTLAPLVRIVILEAGERLLSTFRQALSGYADRHFRREGIEVRTASAVAAVDARSVQLQDGQTVPYGLLIWAAGNGPTELIAGLPTLKRVRHRLVVDPLLRLPGVEDVYIAGDCAAVGDPPLPATAQVAQQQGKYLAKALTARAKGRGVEAFHFKALGMMAYVGSGQALADLPSWQWSGRGAWLFWRSVYLTKLVSPANKVKVLFDWLKARLFGRDLSRF